MALSKRETKILYLTVAIALVAVLWYQGIAPIYDDYLSQQQQLEAEIAKFKDNSRTMADADKIKSEYERIKAQFPKDVAGKKPEESFSEEVMNAAQTILPGRTPQADLVDRVKIAEVDDYEFLTFSIKSIGELQNIAQLLKGFDQKGFLIQKIVLQHQRGVDDPNLSLELTLARIVKVEAQDETGIGRPRKGGRSGR